MSDQAKRNSIIRSGLSLMEVLFAMGVLTVGLLGIASVLPVATNNAAKTLQRDKGTEEVNNTIATEMARIGDQLESVILPNSSLNSHPSVPRYVEVELSNLPNAICIDPWFLTAANNLRDDTGTMDDTTRNGYDRTQFPCYDARYNPLLSPSQQIADSSPFGPQDNPNIWLTPRFARVGLPFSGASAGPSFMAKQNNAREVDNLSLFQPRDTTFPPGLFIQRASGTNTPARNNVSGRYSSMMMMSRSAPGSNIYHAAIVTMLDREVVTVRGGGNLAFQLQPYTAAAPDVMNPPDNQLTYADEVMGYVTYAPRPLVGGGGGEFVFQHSQYTSPRVRSGDWLMLARQEYAGANPSPTIPTFPALATKFAWYQVRSVVEAPRVVSPGVYQTRIAVRGPDWIFHPSQVEVDAILRSPPPYRPGVFVPPRPAGDPGPPEYDYYRRFHQRFGTIVVLMPKVVSVYQTQITL